MKKLGELDGEPGTVQVDKRWTQITFLYVPRVPFFLLQLLIVACLLLEQLTDKWACIRRNCASDMQVGNPLPGRGAPHSAGNLIINPVLDRHWSTHTGRSTLLQLTRAFQNPSFPRSPRNSLSMSLTAGIEGSQFFVSTPSLHRCRRQSPWFLLSVLCLASFFPLPT